MLTVTVFRECLSFRIENNKIRTLDNMRYFDEGHRSSSGEMQQQEL